MLLSLNNATHEIGSRRIVDGASLELRPGEIVGLLGPNGAGKSTLLRLATGLIQPDAGEVNLDGRPLSSWPRERIARQIAFVPQDTHVEFDFPAYEIALMGRNPFLGRFSWPTQEDHAIVRQSMEMTRTQHLAGQAITTLSGGERQRVFLARALAGQTPFLLLDEPTSNLDLEHALHFFHLARSLASDQQRGILMAMHDLNWATRFCDRIVLMSGGRIVSTGAADQVLSAESIREVFHVTARQVGQSPDLAYIFEALT